MPDYGLRLVERLTDQSWAGDPQPGHWITRYDLWRCATVMLVPQRITPDDSSLQHLRSSLGPTRAAIAKRLGVSGSHLSNILAGKRKPGRKLARRLERLYGIAAAGWE